MQEDVSTPQDYVLRNYFIDLRELYIRGLRVFP
jgi:hypothetical protein